MKYELKIIDIPGGVQVQERYMSLTGEPFETIVLLSMGLSATLVTREIYEIMSNEPLRLMDKNLKYDLHYVPTIPNPE